MGAPQYEQAGADIGGTGTTNTIPRWTGPSTLGDSGFVDDGSTIAAASRMLAIGTSGTTGARVWIQNNSSGNTLVLVSPSGAGSAFGQLIEAGTNASDYALNIRQRGTANPLVYVRGDGNVGIGTASPGSILDVLRTQNSTTNAQVRNLSTGAAAQARMDIVSDASTLLLGVVGSGWTTFGIANGDAYISNNSARIIQFGTGGSERMRISGTAAQLAIGTTSFTTGRALTTVADLDVFGVQVGRGGSTSTNVMLASGSNLPTITGTNNVAIGNDALRDAGGQVNNVGVGQEACRGASSDRTGIGIFAASQAGAGTAGCGREAAFNSGADVAAIGLQAGYRCGADNTAIGNRAMGKNHGATQTTQVRNTAVGRQALQQAENGAEDNAALGYYAGQALTTGDDNVLLGANAGDSITTGNSNIVIGSGADVAAAGDSNQLVLGDATNYVATNGGATTYYATAGASLGYMRVRLNGTYVKIEVFADV